MVVIVVEAWSWCTSPISLPARATPSVVSSYPAGSFGFSLNAVIAYAVVVEELEN